MCAAHLPRIRMVSSGTPLKKSWVALPCRREWGTKYFFDKVRERRKKEKIQSLLELERKTENEKNEGERETRKIR